MKKTRFKLLNFVLPFALFLMALTFMFSFMSINEVYAKATESGEQQKTYWNGTMEESFSGDTVLIVLTKDATRQFLTYAPEDFSEIDCVSVEDLTVHTVDWVRKQLNGEDTEEEMLVDVENFRRILSLEIKEKSKENVIAAIKELEKREDVLSAEPNYIVALMQPKDIDWMTITIISFAGVALLIVVVILVVRFRQKSDCSHESE